MPPQVDPEVMAAIGEFRNRLLKIGYLKRISKKQREELLAAHQVILTLPRKLIGDAPSMESHRLSS